MGGGYYCFVDTYYVYILTKVDRGLVRPRELLGSLTRLHWIVLCGRLSCLGVTINSHTKHQAVPKALEGEATVDTNSSYILSETFVP